MTVQARWRATRISSHGRRSSLIGKYAAANRADAAIPLPAMVSIYQFHSYRDPAETGREWSAAARQACLKIRTALSGRRRYVVATGPAPLVLSVVVEAVSRLGYQKTYSAQASQIEQLLDLVAKKNAKAAPGLPVPPCVLVVENIDLLPLSVVRALVDLCDSAQHALVQMVLVGHGKDQDGSGREQHQALASRDHVRVELKPELAGQRASDLENDLARAWQGAGADKAAYPRSGAEAVSPYPALAALLGQSISERSNNRKWMVILTLIVILLCCAGSLWVWHRF